MQQRYHFPAFIELDLLSITLASTIGRTRNEDLMYGESTPEDRRKERSCRLIVVIKVGRRGMKGDGLR